MHQIFIAGFKIHDSDFMIVGGIAFVILWIINRLFSTMWQNKNTETEGTPKQAKPLSTAMKYTFWFANFIGFLILIALITYLFY
jgi:hypothetical protein